MNDIGRICHNTRIVDIVYGTLRDAILNRQLQAGEPLSVPNLARRFGVSRSPVREAVLQLVADGLGTSEPRKGVVVARVVGSDLLALHDIRELLEGLSARRAAELIGPADLANLQRLVDGQAEAVGKKDAALYAATDNEFHGALAVIACDQRLSHFLRILRDQMRLAVSVAMANPDHLTEGQAEHQALIGALAEGDPVKAEDTMRRHIARSRARVEEQLRKPTGELSQSVGRTTGATRRKSVGEHRKT